MSDTILTVPEVAEQFRISVDTVYTMVSRNEIPHFRIGRSVRFEQSAIDKWRRKLAS